MQKVVKKKQSMYEQRCVRKRNFLYPIIRQKTDIKKITSRIVNYVPNNYINLIQEVIDKIFSLTVVQVTETLNLYLNLINLKIEINILYLVIRVNS